MNLHEVSGAQPKSNRLRQIVVVLRLNSTTVSRQGSSGDDGLTLCQTASRTGGCLDAQDSATLLDSRPALAVIDCLANVVTADGAFPCDASHVVVLLPVCV